MFKSVSFTQVWIRDKKVNGCVVQISHNLRAKSLVITWGTILIDKKKPVNLHIRQDFRFDIRSVDWVCPIVYHWQVRLPIEQEHNTQWRLIIKLNWETETQELKAHESTSGANAFVKMVLKLILTRIKTIVCNAGDKMTGTSRNKLIRYSERDHDRHVEHRIMHSFIEADRYICTLWLLSSPRACHPVWMSDSFLNFIRLGENRYWANEIRRYACSMNR